MNKIFRKVQQRYVVVAMSFFGLAVTFALRMSFPIILTQMVYVPNINTTISQTNLQEQIVCPIQYHMIENQTNHEQATELLLNSNKRYQWSQEMQGVILSSFYWGNIFSEIPSSIMIQRFGPKFILLISIALSMIVTVITPLCVEYGDISGLIANRVILGLVQGPIFPSMAAFVVSWYPIEERGRLCSIGYIGISAGGALSTFVSGMLLHYTDRWDVVFYFFTVLLVMWWFLFALLCYEQPKNHPFINQTEKDFLQGKLVDYETERKGMPPTPWKAIAKSSPVLALVFSTALYSWSFYIINTDLPKYLNDVLHVSIEKNGIYSSAPKALSIAVSVGSGFVSDLMLTKYNADRTRVRKIFVVLTSVIPATFLMCASYAGCNEVLAIICLTISISGHGFNSAGGAINLFDLGPNYVAPLNAVINSLATVVGIAAPYIAGIITPNALLSEWRVVFWVTFVLHITESITFTTFGSGVTQSWNSPR